MNKLLLFLTFSFAIINLHGQDITGQWKGEFIDKSSISDNFGNNKCDYVLELELNKNKINGTSYTYFTSNGKKYYTICKIDGFLDKKRKYIEVIETERTKTNIPDNISNCLQVHKLTYFKKGNTETLDGNWTPSSQQGNCGFGTTLLTRRSLLESYPNLISKNQRKNVTPSEPEKKNTETALLRKNLPATSKDKINNKIVIDRTYKDDNSESTVNEKPSTESIESTKITSELPAKVESRKSTILKTIEVENKSIRIEIYDNGEVDGDSISLYFNKKLLLSNKKLSEKAISLTLNIEESDNELVMYAENLGTIPPNTALMVVTDGKNRYEIRITSDLEKSGVIKFAYKPRS